MARRLHPVAQGVSRVDLTAERTAETALRDTWLSFLFIGPTSFVCCRRPRAPKSIAMRRTTRAVPATTSGVSQGRYHGAFLDRRPCSCYPGDLQRLLGIRPATDPRIGGQSGRPSESARWRPAYAAHSAISSRRVLAAGDTTAVPVPPSNGHLEVMSHADTCARSGTSLASSASARTVDRSRSPWHVRDVHSAPPTRR